MTKRKGFIKTILILLSLTSLSALFMGMSGSKGEGESTSGLKAEVTYKAQVMLPADIKLPKEGAYVTVTMLPEVYKNARVDLGDVRILDSKGQAVPYIRYQRSASLLETETQLPLTALDSRREKNRDLYDFETASTISEDVLVDGLDVWSDQSGDYLFDVKIWGSHDGQKFEEITKGNIYRVGTYTSETILFPKTQKYKTYRIETNQPTKTLVPLLAQGKRRTQAWVSDVSDDNAPKTMVESHTTFVQKEVGSQSIITISDVKNLPLTTLNLVTEDVYHRQAIVNLIAEGEKTQVYSGDLFRLFLDNNVLVQPDILLGEQHYRFDAIELIIENKDDKPLKIEDIRLAYLPDQLIFKAMPDEVYSVSYGNPEQTAPEYDLALVVEKLPTLVIARVALGVTEEVMVPVEKDDAKEKRSKLILNLAILLAGLTLGLLSLKAWKRR